MTKKVDHYALLFFLCISSTSASDLYRTIDTTKKYTESKVHFVSNMPKIRDQSNSGMCHAFSTATLLDHHYCKQPHMRSKFRDVCNDDSQLFSTLYLSYLNANNSGIKEGGQPIEILKKIQNGASLVSEKCAPYANFSDYLKTYMLPFTGESLHKKARDEYNSQIATNGTCSYDLASYISTKTEGKELADIQRISRSAPFEKFLYEMFVPKECFSSDDIIITYQLNPKVMDGHNFTKNGQVQIDLVESQIKELISSNKPVILGYKHFEDNGPEEIHGAVISGIKEVCYSETKNCVTMIKLHNSWGENWQRDHDDGWIEARPLIESGLSVNVHLLTWLD